MLGLENPVHIAILLGIVVLLFGAKRLPEIGRSLGTSLREFKQSISGESPQPALTSHGTAASVAKQTPPVAQEGTPPQEG